MSRYIVIAQGCDDSTIAAIDDLTDEQAAVFRNVAGVLNARSRFDCQPTLQLIAFDDADAYDRERATEDVGGDQ